MPVASCYSMDGYHCITKEVNLEKLVAIGVEKFLVIGYPYAEEKIDQKEEKIDQKIDL